MVSSPRCGPSRTGLWPARNGAEPNHVPKGTEVAGLPSVLHALGYEVAAIGKLAHNGWEKIHYKFDHVAGPGLGGTNAEEVAKFLAERDSTKPLCLFVGTH